ncbi:MAG: leucine-rich repeat domain-containing protein, partial [Clostridia bacterium]|nr:leucine-rich repeat domain-containing protein [Clostridia bacterium]
MKKIIKFLIVIMLLASFVTMLAACGGTQNGDGSKDDGTTDVTPGDDTQNDDDTDEDNDGNDNDDEGENTTPEYTYSLVEGGTAYELINVITDEKVITIPALYNDKPVVGIGTEVFRNTQIEEVNLPDTLTYLGERAFSLCISLKKVNLTENSTLQKIGYKAFYQCEYLHTITLPQTLEEVGASAFEGCIDLVNLTIPDSVKVIGANAFDCGWYRSLTEKGVIYVGKVAYSYIQGDEQTATITLKSDTISVAEKAFYRNDIITSVTIPQNVAYIGDLAFNGMSKLQNIIVSAQNAKYSSEGNGLIEVATDKLLVGTYLTEIPAYIATLGK